MSEIRHPNMDMDLGFGPDPQPQPQDNQVPAAGAGQVVLTSEQFQQLLAGIGKQRQELDYAAAITGQEPDALPTIDLDSLPDPRTDFDAFKAALAQGLTAARDQVVEAARSEVNQAQEVNALLNDAWSMMQERHPELVGQEDIVAMARQREVDALAARGIDWTAALRQNMEAAVEKVAGRALATINRVRGLQDGDSGDTDGRTDMITGGSPRPRPAQRGAERESLFTDEIKKAQREAGIY